MDILKLFSALSGLFDSPPKVTPKPEQKIPDKPSINKASHFISSHDKLSQKIKENNKNKT